ncbi:MAG TPA: caspase family protein, partial [Chryseolinea sp.]|nr:caspase family protein [Chryseolinea sp.]
LFARNDALVFKEYAIKTLGVSEKHTFLLTDATRGQMSREIERITELAKLTPDAEIIFYYAGHGLPDFETYQSYLIPVDVTASNLEDAIKLRDLYAKLASSKANKIIVILDACFSGGGRGENGLLAARTVKIRPKSDIVEGNIVAFTATSGKEVSLPFESQSHGLFTYYLLSKLQETEGKLTLDELAQHLESEIPKASLLENGLLQRPQVLVSPELDGKWMSWKF